MSQASQDRAIRPRKTPSQRRSAEMVASIIEAAAQILEIEGLRGFTSHAVARQAGVSVGSLYQYFPGKDAVIAALVARETKRLYHDAAPALDEPTGEAALEYLIGAEVRQRLRRPVLVRLLDAEEDRLALRCEAVTPDTMRTLLVTILERAVPGIERPELVARDVHAMTRGMVDAAGVCGETDIKDLNCRVRAAAFGYLSRSGRS